MYVGSGTKSLLICCLAFVDDIVLLARSAEALQRALNIAEAWAVSVRIKWDIGEEKSAILVPASRRNLETQQSHLGAWRYLP